MDKHGPRCNESCLVSISLHISVSRYKVFAQVWMEAEFILMKFLVRLRERDVLQ